ncbi:MAG: HAMP domain-containing protein [Deltaproteobacteria bacterium]|nr:HAMP domain-containing protein [Deltaproteobacteria bacterium]
MSRGAARLAGIRLRLLAFNALLVFLPVAGVLFLDTYEQQLLADQERSMVEQGRVLAAALSGRGALEEADLERTLLELRQRTGARIRVVDGSGRALADTSLLGPRREPEAEAPDPQRQGWLYRVAALPFRLYREWLGPPQASHGSADVYTSGRPVLGSEVRAALAGRYGAATRISSGGQRSVTLYSALPVVDAGRVVGAVLVSQSTYRILQALYRVRVDVLRVFLASLAAAVVLSLLVSHTIARPLVALRNQAEALLERGRLRGRFEIPGRRDEIGDLARSLEVLRGRLEEHIRGIESFASDVSHEFKNPLASIRTATELLAEVEAPDERKHFAALVSREVARMERLLSTVREMSRLDAGLPADDRGAVDLRELCEGVAEAQRLRGVVVELSGAPSLPVVTSPERIVRVLENLMDNAAGFSPAGATVEVELAREDGCARIRVLDRGPGIPEAHASRIFERFFSYRPAGPDDSVHSGLGLAIARALAESESGTLAGWNRDGGGACLQLSLPLAREA